MFKLTRDEVDSLVKCQIVTSRISHMFQGQSGGRRKLPNVFTEQGIYMLATVLKGELAETQSIFIMRAFREMRHFIAENATLFERISSVELRQLEYQKQADKKFDQLFEYIGEHTETNQKLFFDGQIYDAFSLLIELIQKAEHEIILIDGYVDVGTLNVLAKKKSGVAVTIYTFKKTKLTFQFVSSTVLRQVWPGRPLKNVAIMATTVINKCAIVNVQEVVLWDYSSVGTVAFKSIRRTCPKHGLRRIKILHDYQRL